MSSTSVVSSTSHGYFDLWQLSLIIYTTLIFRELLNGANTVISEINNGIIINYLQHDVQRV